MFIRNTTLLAPEDTLFFLVDIQEKLLPVMFSREKLLGNLCRLISGTKLFNMETLVTEQYPQGLGETVSQVRALLPENAHFFEKKSFSSCLSTEVTDFLSRRPTVRKILLCGMESHVCVQQTALDLLSMGFQVNLVVDAVSSRFEKDYETSLKRMDSSGVFLTTVEAALFELCRTADAPQFKAISRIIRERNIVE